MRVEKGTFLESTASLTDTVFESARLYIAEVNNEGALGFIINRSYNRFLNELEEFKTAPPVPLHDGGPVDREHLFFLHRCPDIIEDGTEVNIGIFYGGNFAQAITALNENRISPADIKIFIGYCGWDKNELEAEIEEGSWIIMKYQLRVF